MTLSSLPQKKTIRLRLIGGPEHGREIEIIKGISEITLPGIGANGLIQRSIYRRSRGNPNIFTYDDGKRRLLTAHYRCPIEAVEEGEGIEKTEAKTYNAFTDWMKEQGCARFEILNYSFREIGEGYLLRAEIYVYAGEILEKTDAEIEEEWAKS